MKNAHLILLIASAIACGEEHKDEEVNTDTSEDTGELPSDTGTETEQENNPINLPIIIEVVAGGYHTCVRFEDNTLDCWGQNTYSQSNPPTGEYTQLAAGEHHTCAISIDGNVVCWGLNTSGQSVTQEGDFVVIDAGKKHTCGIEGDNTAICWNETISFEAPSDSFLLLSTGNGNTCGIKDDEQYSCWGFDATEYSNYLSSGPTESLFDIAVLENPSGEWAPCACSINTTGEIDCWGQFEDWEGVCKPSLKNNIPSGTGTTSNFIQVEAGDEHLCALDVTGVAHCWGVNDSEEIEAPFGTHNFSSIAVGYDHNCGLRDNGELLCWGDDTHHQLGQYGWSPE